MDHQCANAPSKDMALRAACGRTQSHTLGPRFHAPLAWHMPSQWIINVRLFRLRSWLCVRPAAARKAASLDAACMRRLHGTRHCNGSSMCDRSVQRSGFACGLRQRAEACGLKAFHGDDASMQPGHSGDLWLHETAVSWMRHRLRVTVPQEPWRETEAQYESRLKAAAAYINEHHDVEGLCKTGAVSTASAAACKPISPSTRTKPSGNWPWLSTQSWIAARSSVF